MGKHNLKFKIRRGKRDGSRNSGHFPKVIFTLFLYFLVQGIFATHVHASAPTLEQVRPWVKLAYGLVDVSDQVLDDALAKSPLSGSRPFLDVFGYFLEADRLVNDLYLKDNYYDAAETAMGIGFDWVISDTFLGEVLATPLSVANLAALPIQYSLDAFINQIEKNAWDTQIKLYIAARRAGMSELDVLQGYDDNSKGIFFTNGWLLSVGDIIVPHLGLISPDGATKEQVYGVAQNIYKDVDNLAFYQRDKDTAGAEFKKILYPTISFSPTYPKAPVNITFSVAGQALAEMNIVGFSWDFGDGQTASGQIVSHLYRVPKTYQVTLTLTDGGGGTHVYSESVVISPPEIDVTYPDPDGYESLSRNFSTPSSPYVSQYSWNYGDPSPPDTDRTPPLHTYGQSGYYTVTLTLTLDDNSTIQSQTGIVVGHGTRYIQGHTIYGSEKWYNGGTYVVEGNITIAQGATLTIEPGTIVKFVNNSGISINGTLIADGTADNKIVFTHITDDNETYGGDTNGDGDATHPGPYQDQDGNWHSNLWYAIHFGPFSTNSVINHAVINYGGLYCFYSCGLSGPLLIDSSSVSISNSEISNIYSDGIDVTSSSPLIMNNIISNTIPNNSGPGIRITNGSPIIIGNTITGVNNAYGIYIRGVTSLPHISGNKISNYWNAISADNIVSTSGIGHNIVTDNQVNGIVFSGSWYDYSKGNLTVNATWHPEYIYVASGPMSIAEGITLTIEPGTIVKFDTNSGIGINGTLIADGTADNKIVFTHITDDNETYGGDTNGDGDATHPGVYEASNGDWYYNVWVHLAFGPTSTSSVINNAILRYGGVAWAWVGGYMQETAPLNIASSSVSVSNSEISDSYTSGISVSNDASPSIKDNIISNNNWAGVRISNGSPTITGNTITGLNSRGIYCEGNSSVPTIHNNLISGNTEYGISNNAYYMCPDINATNNNWGDSSGPLDDSDDRATGGLYNPTGLGNRVSDHVNYYPWTGMIGIDLTDVPTGLSGTSSYSSVNLAWNANTEPYLGGYKIYYGTSSGNYGTPKLVGTVSSDILTGLSNGMPYYIAISSLNSVGIESAKCAEIIVTPKDTFDLSVTKSGAGTVSASGLTCNENACTGTYGYNAQVNITASDPNIQWGGCDSSNGSQCTVTMITDKTVTAIFTASEYTLTADKAGTGSGTVSGAGPYSSGDTAVVTAVADLGSTFTGWAGDCSGTISPLNVLMDSTKTCTATFGDTQSPDLVVSTLSDGSWTNNGTLNISGTVNDNMGTPTLTINGATAMVNPDGTFSHALILIAGPNAINTIASDLAGLQTTDTRTINFDLTAPYIEIATPADNSKTKQSAIEVSGTVDESSLVTVKVNDYNPLPAQMNGNNFTLSVPLTYGINTIEVMATDLAANNSTSKRTVTYDDQGPALSVTDPGQDVKTNQSNILIKGKISDITAATVTVSQDQETFTPAVTNGSFEQLITFTVEKTYQIYVTATDELGNETTVQRNIIYDTVAPDATITSGPINPSNSTSASFSFTSTDSESSFQCQMDNGGYQPCTSPASYTNLSVESHTFYVKATDAAGNTDPTPASYTWTITPAQMPDLSGKWKSLTTKFKGKQISGTLQVTNSGNANAGAFSVAYYLSNDGITPLNILSSSTVAGLKAGKSVNLTFSYNTTTSLTGKYIIAVIDSGNQIAETNESNNTAAARIP